MRRGNIPPLMIGSLGMILLIFDGKAAVSGVKDGLELCIQTLIPSLFPFFVLSSLVTGALSGVSVAPLRWLSRFCRMPDGADSLLLVGILGGYPVGAGNIAAEYHNGRLLLTDARRLSIFCNNAGPSFLFGSSKFQPPFSPAFFFRTEAQILFLHRIPDVFPFRRH